uniref:HEPN AbiU2-like domain-containing protein n=1 Tax=Caulobacter sp. (strain K31) TaxID=366602 RepID=B0T9C2_CAUSK
MLANVPIGRPTKPLKAHMPATSDKILDDLANDLLWLLIGAFVYRRRAQLEGLPTWSSQHLSEEFFLLEAAQRDLIMRLTALDDRGRGQRSFPAALKALKDSGAISAQGQAEADAAIRAFRELINDMKVKHRNAYIGHVLDEESSTPRLPQAPANLNAAIAAAVALGDRLAGVRKGYLFKLPGGERIDLRQALGV